MASRDGLPDKTARTVRTWLEVIDLWGIKEQEKPVKSV